MLSGGQWAVVPPSKIAFNKAKWNAFRDLRPKMRENQVPDVFLCGVHSQSTCPTASTGVRMHLVRSRFPAAFEIDSECV
jgi:hypothetical protein